MKKIETLGWLNHCLIDEMPQYRKQAESFPPDEDSQWQLFRSLVNVRPPKEAGEEFLRIQDTLLQEEIGQRELQKWKICSRRGTASISGRGILQLSERTEL